MFMGKQFEVSVSLSIILIYMLLLKTWSPNVLEAKIYGGSKLLDHKNYYIQNIIESKRQLQNTFVSFMDISGRKTQSDRL